MRILALLTDAFGRHGGIAKFNRDLLRALCAFPGCEEVVGLCRHGGETAERIPEKFRIVQRASRGRFAFAVAALAACRGGARFDLIVCGHIHLMPVALLCRSLTGAPIVLVIHGVEAWRPNRRPLVNLAARHAGAVVSVSELTRERFESWCRSPGRRSFILPNGVDLDAFAPGPADPGLIRRYGLDGRRVVLTLGRLDKGPWLKGFDRVIAALPALLSGIPELVYVVAGDGAGRHELAALARAAGVAERVVFTGFVRDEEKAAHYRLADAFVLPSLGEGFGIVLIEAMACGIPVVASRLDGGREAVQGGMLGVLVDPESPDDIRRGIGEALSRPKGVRPAGLEVFSSAAFERRAHAILDELRAGGPRR